MNWRRFLRDTNFKWWQKKLLELSMIALGIILGATFWGPLSDLMPLWWIIFLAGGGYIGYIWYK